MPIVGEEPLRHGQPHPLCESELGVVVKEFRFGTSQNEIRAALAVGLLAGAVGDQNFQGAVLSARPVQQQYGSEFRARHAHMLGLGHPDA